MAFLLKLYTDASAAEGVMQRHGAGAIKYLDVKSVRCERGRGVVVLKVFRLEKCSDLLANHCRETALARHLAGANV